MCGQAWDIGNGKLWGFHFGSSHWETQEA